MWQFGGTLGEIGVNWGVLGRNSGGHVQDTLVQCGMCKGEGNTRDGSSCKHWGCCPSHTPCHSPPLQPVGSEFLADESPWDLSEDVAPGAVDYPHHFGVPAELGVLGRKRRGWGESLQAGSLPHPQNPQPPKTTEPALSQTRPPRPSSPHALPSLPCPLYMPQLMQKLMR